MLYQKNFKNKYFGIKLKSNNKRIIQAISRHLDFTSHYSGRPEVVSFSINIKVLEVGKIPAGSSLIYKNKFAGELLFSKISPLVERVIDWRKQEVKVTVHTFDDDYKEHIVDFTVMRPLHFILAKKGLFFIHSSIVSKGLDCVLVSGPQNSGKTTLALALLGQGFSFITDDDCFLASAKDGRVRLIPLDTKIGLNDKTALRYPHLKSRALKGYRYGNKLRISSRHLLQSASNGSFSNCRMVVFPKYMPHSPLSLKPLSQAEALKRLMRDNDWMHGFYRQEKIKADNFFALYTFIRNAKIFELNYDDKDIAEACGMINRFFLPF